MSRLERDREDLLREATALVERAEIRLGDFDEAVIVGFRSGGAARFYFGADPVFQFNADNQLRRGFVGGRLVKANEGRLYWLDRLRTSDESILQRSPLDDAEVEILAGQIERCLGGLLSALKVGEFELVGQHPESADVPGRIAAWLEQAPRRLVIASSPRVGGW